MFLGDGLDVLHQLAPVVELVGQVVLDRISHTLVLAVAFVTGLAEEGLFLEAVKLGRVTGMVRAPVVVQRRDAYDPRHALIKLFLDLLQHNRILLRLLISFLLLVLLGGIAFNYLDLDLPRFAIFESSRIKFLKEFQLVLLSFLL